MTSASNRFFLPWVVAIVAGFAVSAQPAPRRLTLEDAINRALLANRGLAEAGDQVRRVQFSTVAANAEFELKLFPGANAEVTDVQENVGAGIALQKKFPVGTQARVEPAIRRIGDFYSAGVDLSLNQPLLRGVKREFNLSGVYGAQFADRSAGRSLYLTQVSTVLDTVTATYEVIRQRELVSLHEESEHRLRGHAAAARTKEKIGLASSIDTYRATIELKQAEDDLTTAREAFGDSLDDLKLILALPLEDEIEVDAPLAPDLARMAEDEAIAVALENRVELDQAADTIGEVERQSRVAKHNTLPDLNLVLNYSRFGFGDNLGDSTTLDQDTWGIGLETRTDVARTVERAAYGQSLIAVGSARRSESLQRDEIVRQVKRELRSLDRSEQRMTIQQEKGEQAKGQLELARIKFKHGLADNFDLIDAETELRRAQVDRISARIDYLLGTYRLRATLGTLLERPETF